jgi:hypothetical protein
LSHRRLSGAAWRAYHDFYRWGSILRGTRAHDDVLGGLRHAAFAIAWKKAEPVWNAIVAFRRVADARPLLETVLAGVGRAPARSLRTHRPVPRARVLA